VRRFAAVAVLAAVCLPAPAYYHYIHYLNGANVPEKFDLTALPGNTVTFFVSETGPATYNQTDSFSSVLSQISQATQVWNGVSASALRVAFGGLENASTQQNTPGSDVVFEDLPPGLYGYGGPTANLTATTAADGTQFVPITRSAVHLNRNLTILPPTSTGPSYTSTFFLTCVHEMGHALGLQHTFTSAAMSQVTTRATTLSHPIDTDDIAGLAVLYPTPASAQMGTISGRITSGGTGLHLTSVVAIHPGWGAVSALTNPDGTFKIQGVPAGQYFVYAHALPPDADIKGPWNADGSVAAPSGPTNALFYTADGAGTTNPQQAVPISVQAGAATSGINIGLSNRSAVQVYDVQLFGYFNYNSSYVAVQPAFVDQVSLTQLGGAIAVNATGNGPEWSGQLAGLKVQALGGSVNVYGSQIGQSNGAPYASLFMTLSVGASNGPQHLIFNTPDYMFVAPAGLSIAQNLPPTVAGVAKNANGTATVSGANWASDSLIYFDGLPAAITSLDPVKGVAVVTPPSGAAGQISVVSVYNSDGQNSQFLQSSAPVTYAYGNAPTTLISAISPSSLPAGSESMVDITTSGFALASGQVTVGFGTTDVVVRRVFVLSPNHLQVDVSVAAGAALANPDVSVINGFQIATATAGFQITPRVTGAANAIPVLTNATPGLTGSYAGALVSLYGSNLASGTTAPTITIGGQTAGVIYASPTQINLQIPAGLSPGPAILQLNNGVAAAYPVLVNIDTPPAGINAIQNGSGGYIDSTHPAHQGDLLIVSLSNFASGATIDPSRVQVGVAGVMHSVLTVTTPVAGLYQVAFLLNTSDKIGQTEQLVVYLDGRSSNPATIPLANPDGSFTLSTPTGDGSTDSGN
jgi:uncharacterized protein (TIGR03437 family)